MIAGEPSAQRCPLSDWRSAVGQRADFSIGQRFAAWRKHRGYAQREIAAQAGVHASYLSRVEAGRVNPTVATATRIAEALGLTLDHVLKFHPAGWIAKPCPVSRSGRCVLDLIDRGAHTVCLPNEETYTPRQLRLVRRFMALVGKSDTKRIKLLETLVGGFLDGSAAEPMGGREGPGSAATGPIDREAGRDQVKFFRP